MVDICTLLNLVEVHFPEAILYSVKLLLLSDETTFMPQEVYSRGHRTSYAALLQIYHLNIGYHVRLDHFTRMLMLYRDMRDHSSKE